MQACVCSLPPPVQILALAPSHCPGAHLDILDYGVSLLGHEEYNLFLLEAGQSRCLGASVGCFFPVLSNLSGLLESYLRRLSYCLSIQVNRAPPLSHQAGTGLKPFSFLR